MTGRGPRVPVGVRLAAVTALLVLAVGALLLATSYWLLVTRLPESVALELPTGEFVVTVGQTVPSDGSVVDAPTVDVAGTAVAVPPEQVDATVVSAVQAATLDYETVLMRRFATQSALLLGALTVAAVAVGGFAARRALRPVHAMTAAARRLGEESLGARLPVSGPRDELRELAETFNGMLDRVEAAFGRERRLMANVSHELRTPLANQRLALEVGLEDTDASAADLRDLALTALAQNRRAHHLIEELLVLARAEQERRDEPVTDLAEVAAEATDAVRALPGTVPDLDLRLALTPAPVRGEPVLLERLVGNLVENAARHNVRGGFVRVTTTVTDDGGRVEVENSGPVIPQESLGALFEPFRRGPAADGHRVRSDRGVGLGLSVVTAVVRRYGGRVESLARPEGGLRVAVTLPPITRTAQRLHPDGG